MGVATALQLELEAVVNDAAKSAASVSGGSFVSTSFTPAACTRIWHVAPDGSPPGGARTTLVVPEAAPLLVTRLPGGHSTRTAPAATLTASLKVTVSELAGETFVAPFAGDVASTFGAVSPQLCVA